MLGSKIEQVLDLVTDFCVESDTLVKLLEEKIDTSGTKSEVNDHNYSQIN